MDSSDKSDKSDTIDLNPFIKDVQAVEEKYGLELYAAVDFTEFGVVSKMKVRKKQAEPSTLPSPPTKNPAPEVQEAVEVKPEEKPAEPQ